MATKKPLLRKYFLSLSTEDRDKFAQNCGTTVGQIEHIYRGNRSCSETLAIEIEKHSNGQIRCEMLCPETDFAYLRGTELQTA